MKLVEELIAAATGSSIPTSELLRKMLVLGSNLDSAEIQEWGRRELYGYGNLAVELYPPYRGPV